MKWGDSKRDFDTVLAVWPSYRPLHNHWRMQELIDHSPLSPKWRDRRIPAEDSSVRADVYADRQSAAESAQRVNESCNTAFEAREMEPTAKTSLKLKIDKALQAKERLRDEEALMLSEARRRHVASPRSAAADLPLAPQTEQYRDEIVSRLQDMPYLRMLLLGEQWSRRVIYKRQDGTWSKPDIAYERTASQAEHAKIANGFDLSAEAHWGQTKAEIREILRPRANKLLILSSVQRMLAEALARGEKVLVCNGFVFWYEEDGSIGWQVKTTTSTSDSEGATLWKEGTIRSTNHGRLVILPYIKENGEHVSGHTKNAPHDGRAAPRHPDHYVDIPFKQLAGDLMIGLLGELPYE